MPEIQPGSKFVIKRTKKTEGAYALSCYIQFADGSIEDVHDNAGPISYEQAGDGGRECAQVKGYWGPYLDWQDR